MTRCLARALVLAAVLAVAACTAPGSGGAARPDASAPTPTPTPPPAVAVPVTPRSLRTIDGVPPQVAVAAVDLAHESVLFSQHDEVLDRPMLPGSVAKLFALRAALDAGVVDGQTRVACRRRERVGGHLLECAHPPFAAPPNASEALAHSCNSFFVALARRLPRTAHDAALRAVSLPAMPTGADPVLAVVGLDGTRATPRQWLRAVSRLVSEAVARGDARDTILLDGMRDAARRGTAAALGARGVEAFAKTGSGRILDGAAGGIVVAVAPTARPTVAVVVVGAGIAGADAAGIAATVLTAVAPGLAPGQAVGGSPTIGVGRYARGGVERIEIPLEDYVARVVAAEAPPDSPGATREALAVAARSFAIASRGRHAKEGFDLCDTTHCQATAEPDAAARAAARATAGRVLVWHDAVVPAHYAASCGGRLESPSAPWHDAGALDTLLPARTDPAAWMGGAPPEDVREWVSDVAAPDLLRALRAAGRRGVEVRGVEIVQRTASGRAGTLRVPGLVPETVDAEDFRLAVGRTLGWQVLKSSRFDVERTARGYRFRGRGVGHGVGMCVAGAAALARHGLGAEAILAVYFPGAALRDAASGPAPVRVLLPATEVDEQRGVAALAETSLSATERTLDAARPAGITVRFRDSVESYQRATGQRWWTSGATRGAEVELLPLPVLRTRGLLDRTLRHEFVHVLTDAPLAYLPRWMREGLAVVEAGARVPRERGVPCPTDTDLDAAADGDGLAAAYARAAACTAAALEEAGGNWRRLTPPASAGAKPSP